MVNVRYVLRKSIKNTKKTLSILPLIIVGTMFFILLFSLVSGYENSTLEYFEKYNYADYTLYGNFDDSIISDINNNDTIAEGRYVKDYKLDKLIVRTISFTQNANNLYLYNGSLNLKKNNCLMLNRNAKALGLSVGDEYNFGDNKYIISGLVESPEYVYLVRDEKSIMNEPDKFVVIYLNNENFSGNYNEILIKSNIVLEEKVLQEKSGASIVLLQNEQINFNLFESDLNEMSSFAYIFPILFLVIIGVIIFVNLKRTIAIERKSIATMKAIGASNARITLIYLTQFILLSIIGALSGCLFAFALSDYLISLFSAMFIVPIFKFKVYPLVWLTAIFVMVGISILSGLISLVAVFKLEPAEAMRPADNSRSKKILLEKTSVWKKLSFNTRYTLKNTMRNKGRFFASTTAIVFALSLLILSYGFMDSITGTKNAYFYESANYNYVIQTDFKPYSLNDDVINYCGDNYEKVLELTVKINGDQVPVKIVDNDFDLIKLPKGLDNGIILPTYYADKWNVKKGDSIKIDNLSYQISQVEQQYISPTIFISYEYAGQINESFVPIYNCVFVKGEPANLIKYLDDNKRFYSSLDDDVAVFQNVSGNVKILTNLMNLCAIILGIFSLYSIGLVNLSSRENEYAQLMALGYSNGKIVLTQLKEMIMQFLISLPFGILGGNLLLQAIKGDFSNQSFCIKPTIYFKTYLLSVLIVIILLAVILLISSMQIKKINIVEKLKSLD